MWHYLVANNPEMGKGSMSFEEYKRKMDLSKSKADELIRQLLVQSIKFIKQYEDAVWVETNTEREFTRLVLLAMHADCLIEESLTDQDLTNTGS